MDELNFSNGDKINLSKLRSGTNIDDKNIFLKKYDKNGIIHSWGADKIPYTRSYTVCFPSFRNDQKRNLR